MNGRYTWINSGQPSREGSRPLQHTGLPYGIIDPDYARVYTQARIVAWQYGFALLLNGSFTRDLDLLLVPWEARATAAMAEHVVKRIADVTELKVAGEPGTKPHGRRAYTLVFPGFKDVRWLDLSVMPSGPLHQVERCIRCGYLQGHAKDCPNA
jgi:hypothetical protein